MVLSKEKDVLEGAAVVQKDVFISMQRFQVLVLMG